MASMWLVVVEVDDAAVVSSPRSDRGDCRVSPRSDLIRMKGDENVALRSDYCCFGWASTYRSTDAGC